LDAYRAVLMLMGILLHGAFPFYGEAPDPLTHGALDFSVWIVHTFRMPAFFMLSGFFGALLWARRGAASMLMNRFERIVLPLFTTLLVVIPVAGYLAFCVAGVIEGQEELLGYAARRFWDELWPNLSFEHLWFLYYLVWLSFGTAWFLRWSRARQKTWPRTLAFVRQTFESPWRFVFVLGASNVFLGVFLDRYDPPAGTDWAPNILYLGYYALFYGFGWALYVARVDVSASADRAWTLVALGAVSTVAYIWGLDTLRPQTSLFDNPGLSDVGGWAFLLATWSVALFALTRGLMGLFYRYTSGPSYAWRYVSDSSYWIYLIHILPCVGIPDLLRGTGWPIGLKFILSVALTALIGFVTYDLFVRSTFLGRFLNGRRYARGPARIRIAGIVLLAGSMTALSINRIDYGERHDQWRAAGGALSAVPFALRPAEKGKPKLDGDGECVGIGPYAVCAREITFDTARKACLARGGKLAVLETRAENERVMTMVAGLTHDAFWVDLTDRAEEGEWVWADKQSLDYDAWAKHQPDDHRKREDCAHINWNGLQWNDVNCDARMRYLCEWSPLTEPADGASSCGQVLAAVAAWQAEGGPVSLPEKAVVAAVTGLCAKDQSTADDTGLPDGTPPSMLAGVWDIVPDARFAAPGFLALSKRTQRLARSRLATLDARIVFGAREVALLTQVWDGDRVAKKTYRVITSTDGKRVVAVGAGDDALVYEMAAEGDLLVISHADERWTLRRQSAADPPAKASKRAPR